MKKIVLALLGLSISLQAADEFEQAMQLEPNLENGKQIYKRICLTCHGPEGWGVAGSGYPQIAGQLKDVLIKQLADFRAGNRDNPIMRTFSSPRALGGAQDIADVAAYISQLPMTANNEKGMATDLATGKAIYEKECQDCHGARGEGNPEDHAPRIQAQHYSYLMRQFNWIRNGMRRNADPKMVKQIERFTAREQALVLSYVSHLPPDNPAPPGWRNTDFDFYSPHWRPAKIR